MDNMVTIYKEDSTKESWACILNDLDLPADADEICVKHISHITKSKRQEKRNKDNADSDNS